MRLKREAPLFRIMVRVKLDQLDPPALQDNGATVALRSGGGKLEAVAPPESQPAILTPYRAQFAQHHAVIQKRHIHPPAVGLGGLIGNLLNLPGHPPVGGTSSQEQQPE